MPAPIAKGIIIGATIIVAAGIALYENEKVRDWINQNTRKIAIAINGPGHSRPHSAHAHGSASADEEWRRHQQEQMIRRRRSAIIQKARDEGVAVDLDELSRVGKEGQDFWRMNLPPVKRADSGRSFDEMVGSDGMLKERNIVDEKDGQAAVSTSTDIGNTHEGIRARGRAEEGLNRGAVFANPFADEADLDQLDDSIIGVSQYEKSGTESPSTLAAETQAHSPAQLIDVSESSARTLPESHETTFSLAMPLSASIHSSSTDPMVAAGNSNSQSFYSVPSPAQVRSRNLSVASGMLTPTSDAFLTGDSVIGSQADDIAVMSPGLHSVDNDDAMSEAFSELGTGHSTPGSWTDVGSEAGSEYDLQNRQ